MYVNQLKFLLLHARRDMESQLIIRWCDLKSADIWSSVAPLLCGGDAFASATLEMLDWSARAGFLANIFHFWRCEAGEEVAN